MYYCFCSQWNKSRSRRELSPTGSTFSCQRWDWQKAFTDSVLITSLIICRNLFKSEETKCFIYISFLHDSNIIFPVSEQNSWFVVYFIFIIVYLCLCDVSGRYWSPQSSVFIDESRWTFQQNWPVSKYVSEDVLQTEHFFRQLEAARDTGEQGGGAKYSI